MNKKDIVKSLTRVLSTHKEAQDAVDRVFKEMVRALRDGEKLVISELGTFHPYVTKARHGRNPRTGEPVDSIPRRKVRFRQSRDLFKF